MNALLNPSCHLVNLLVVADCAKLLTVAHSSLIELQLLMYMLLYKHVPVLAHFCYMRRFSSLWKDSILHQVYIPYMYMEGYIIDDFHYMPHFSKASFSKVDDYLLHIILLI